MEYTFKLPAHLMNQSVDEIHRRMLAALPDDIDKSELQLPWDFTRPSAVEKASFVEYDLTETIKLIYPQWAYGEWLDLHAQLEGISRLPANVATGYLRVTGKPGTSIAKGCQFATLSSISSSVIFEAADDVVIGGKPDVSGHVTVAVPIVAAACGVSGNVPPGTITMMVKPDTNIISVANPEATTGGTPEENDESLRERVMGGIRRGISFTGCDADYVRWAKEVPGVGEAVPDPEWDDPGLPESFVWTDNGGNRHKAGAVRLFIIDANGVPANQQILDTVYDHIIRPDNRMARLAPIGAKLTVAAPVPLYIDVSAKVTLREGYSIDNVVDVFRSNLDAYWLQASTENDVYDIRSGNAYNSIKYVYIGATLADTAGVTNYDHSSLMVNSAVDDILIHTGEYPVTREVNLIE